MARKPLESLNARDLEGYFRDLIKRIFGDKTENAASITASSGGNYRIVFEPHGDHCEFSFKKKNARRVAKAIRALKEDRPGEDQSNW